MINLINMYKEKRSQVLCGSEIISALIKSEMLVIINEFSIYPKNSVIFLSSDNVLTLATNNGFQLCSFDESVQQNKNYKKVQCKKIDRDYFIQLCKKTHFSYWVK